jgi:hypothetical protein
MPIRKESYPLPRGKRWLSLLALTVVLVVAIGQPAAACPSCKAALAASEGDLVRGFFFSIVFLMSMPFVILASLFAYFYWQVKRARQAAALLAVQTPPPADTLEPGDRGPRPPADQPHPKVAAV